MSADTFCYVHAEDWHGIWLAPAVNRPQIEAMMNSGDAPDNDNTFGDVRIELGVLRAMFADTLAFTERLMTGYTTDTARVANGFAFYDDDFGAVYGTQQNGLVNALYFHNTFCDCGIDFSDVMTAMEQLAARYELIMVDWLMETIVNLSETGAMARYFEEM